MRIPMWTKYYRVDEVIECFTLGANRQSITKELLTLMPNVYDSHPDDPDGEVGKNEWPEADSHKDRKLSCIWCDLSLDTQTVLTDAYTERLV